MKLSERKMKTVGVAGNGPVEGMSYSNRNIYLQGYCTFRAMEDEMNNIDELKRIIASHMDTLRNEYHVNEIGIFGSYIRGEQKAGSDIDILVDFSQPVGLFAFIGLEEYLHDILNAKVDLVLKDGIKPLLKENILHEVVYV